MRKAINTPQCGVNITMYSNTTGAKALGDETKTSQCYYVNIYKCGTGGLMRQVPVQYYPPLRPHPPHSPAKNTLKTQCGKNHPQGRSKGHHVVAVAVGYMYAVFDHTNIINQQQLNTRAKFGILQPLKT